MYRPDFSRTEQEWTSSVSETISKSVEAHLISDVPFGAFLSGGLDSTLITGIMSGQLHHPVDTFSIGFNDSAFDERVFAKQAAKFYRTVTLNLLSMKIYYQKYPPCFACLASPSEIAPGLLHSRSPN